MSEEKESVTGRMTPYRIWQQFCIFALIGIAGWMATNVDEMKTMMAKAMTKIEQHEKNFVDVDERLDDHDKHFKELDDDVAGIKIEMATIKAQKR